MPVISKEVIRENLLHIAVKAVDLRHSDTKNHSINVKIYSLSIADHINKGKDERNTIKEGALLHDLGKISFPDNLFTAKKLSDKQIIIQKTHPSLGYNAISEVNDQIIDDGVKEIVLSHHEKLNGSGYPKGLDGSAISENVRIVMVADMYEAMVSKRAYRKHTYSRETAIEELEKEANAGKIDPKIVKILKKVLFL